MVDTRVRHLQFAAMMQNSALVLPQCFPRAWMEIHRLPDRLLERDEHVLSELDQPMLWVAHKLKAHDEHKQVAFPDGSLDREQWPTD